MKLSDAVRTRINNLLITYDTNVWKLFKNTGVPVSTLSHFLNGDRDLISLKTLLHICEGFNIDLKTFFDDSLFDDIN